MTHWRSAEEKLRLDWIEGSATLTMLRSRITMNWATQQTTRTQVVVREPRWPSAACSLRASASRPVRAAAPLYVEQPPSEAQQGWEWRRQGQWGLLTRPRR